MNNDYDIVRINFNTFISERDGKPEAYYYDCYYNKFNKVFPYINDSLKDIGFQEFQNKKVLPNINFNFENRDFWYWKFRYTDPQFIKYCLDCKSNKRLNEAIVSINQNRFIIRKRILKKFYKSVLACVLDELFGDNITVSHFNYTIFNYNSEDKEVILTSPLYKDDNYNIPKLNDKCSFMDTCNFLKPKSIFNFVSLSDLVSDIAFIELYDSVGSLLFRILNSYDKSFNLLKDAMIDNRKDIYDKNDLDELRYYSGINFYKILEIKNGIYNFG